ncbi:hypothetical protein GGR51DRAFT_229503 [Nemania sp. FL0031]|nr:hypothetical protein GGR51DRAFT_229503 [Nemania sp. FL0031]
MKDDGLVGWVSTPNGRGTLSIAYSCATVIITAIWTILHLNVPGKAETLRQTLPRKVRWGLFAIFAPDMLTMVAASQWVKARKSVEQMKELSNLGVWTLVHAFYANSGGFILQPKNEIAFPVNAEQIYFLVSHSYIPFPKITEDEIWDKSKADWFAKGFALLQIGWLIIQSVARAVDGLSISPSEIFTLAFVASTTMSYFFWWNKPQDVKTPTILHCGFSMSIIRTNAGVPPNASYTDSPLDFIPDPDKFWERNPSLKDYDLERQMEAGSQDRARLQRVPDDAILMTARLPSNVLVALIIPSLIHSTVHLLGWNFAYPSSVEQLLWRISVVTLASVSAVAVGIIHMLDTFGYQGRYNLTWVWIKFQREEPRSSQKCQKLLDMVLGFVVLLLTAARLYIILEAILSLRSLPADVFVTVNWTDFFPHV